MKEYIKNNKKSVILAGVTIVVVALLIALPFIAEKSKKNNTSEASILSSTVEKGEITKSLSGTGTLTAEDSEDISLPEGVELKKYLVQNSQLVKEGDPLAEVDRQSVLIAMYKLSDTMKEIEAELFLTQDDTVSTDLSNKTGETSTGEYAVLANTHRKYEEIAGKLAKWYLDGYISAPFDGMVTGIDEDAAKALLKFEPDGNEEYYVNLLTVTQDYSIFSLSEEVNEVIGSKSVQASLSGIGNPSCSFSTVVVSVEGKNYQFTPSAEFNALKGLKGGDPALNDVFEFNVEYSIDEEGNITWGTPNVVGFVSGSIAGTVTVKAKLVSEAPLFSDSVSVKINNTEYPINLNEWGITADQLLKLKGKDAKELAKGDEFEFSASYIISADETIKWTSVTPKSYSKSDGKMPGGGFGGGGGMLSDTSDQFPLEETVIMSVVPTDKMYITITVDELDILSLNVGDDATVTIDALPGTSFEGKVTKIDKAASNNGGNTKFSAEITMPRDEKMLDGMNASSIITVDVKNDVLLIPAEAISEQKDGSYVYLSKDKNDNLTDPVKIKTGWCDGEKAEIVSGLEEGQKFYYSYYDQVDEMPGFGNRRSGRGSLFGGLGRGGRR